MAFSGNAKNIDWIATQLVDLFDTPDYREVSIERYRIDLSQLENDNRFWCRVAVYSGGDNASGQIPGFPSLQPKRVQHGKATDTIQIYNIDVSWNASFRKDDGNLTEFEAEQIKDIIITWVQDIGATVSTLTDGSLATLVYGSSTQATRIRKYATLTITLYAMRSLINCD